MVCTPQAMCAVPRVAGLAGSWPGPPGPGPPYSNWPGPEARPESGSRALHRTSSPEGVTQLFLLLTCGGAGWGPERAHGFLGERAFKRLIVLPPAPPRPETRQDQKDKITASEATGLLLVEMWTSCS